MIWDWVKFLGGGIVGWWLVELDRLSYARNLGLVFRTSLVAAAWVVVAIFTISSSGSRWAVGLVLGVGAHLVSEFWHGRLVWPIKRQVSQTEEKIFGWLLTLVWSVLAIWAV